MARRRKDIPGPGMAVSTETAANMMAELKRSGHDQTLLAMLRDWQGMRLRRLNRMVWDENRDWIISKAEFANICRLQGSIEAFDDVCRKLMALRSDPMVDPVGVDI